MELIALACRRSGW